MYDFLLQINSKSFFDPYKKNAFFERSNTERVDLSGIWFMLNGLTNDLNEYCHSDFRNIIWIYGNIFLRDGFVNKTLKKLSIKEILSDLLDNKDLHQKYKGNYSIFRIDKINKCIQIINSQLGICHVYYYHNSDIFVVSNNLNHFKHLDLGYNSVSICQKMMFTYEIDNSTSFNNVKRIRPGEIIEFSNGNVKSTLGFNLNSLFEPKTLERFNVEKYIYLFNTSIKERALYDDNINVSFTGGFDGRTIISSLLNQGLSFYAYSFGKHNGENTRIPLSVSRDIGINYNPVYLEEDYENNYVNDAKKVIYLSDGMSFNERANYIYTFRKLAKKSRYVITGLIGGETLRPVHLRTDYINENYYQLFYLNNQTPFDGFINSKFNYEFTNFINTVTIIGLREIIQKKQHEIKEFRKKENGFLYYLFDLMETGFRMYYGTEIHFERQYCNNLTPFYDLDLLQYLLSTDYVEIFKQAFKHGKIHRWGGQKIYAKIIEKNYNQLNQYSVDRGYPPGYLLNPLKLVFVPYLYYRRKRNRKYFIDFDERKWSKLFLSDFINSEYKNEMVFSQIALKEMAKKNILSNIYSSQLNRAISLQTWLNQKD